MMTCHLHCLRSLRWCVCKARTIMQIPDNAMSMPILFMDKTLVRGSLASSAWKTIRLSLLWKTISLWMHLLTSLPWWWHARIEGIMQRLHSEGFGLMSRSPHVWQLVWRHSMFCIQLIHGFDGFGFGFLICFVQFFWSIMILVQYFNSDWWYFCMCVCSAVQIIWSFLFVFWLCQHSLGDCFSSEWRYGLGFMPLLWPGFWLHCAFNYLSGFAPWWRGHLMTCIALFQHNSV